MEAPPCAAERRNARLVLFADFTTSRLCSGLRRGPAGLGRAGRGQAAPGVGVDAYARAAWAACAPRAATRRNGILMISDATAPPPPVHCETS